MELTENFLKQRQKEHLATSENFREQYVANQGAAQAIARLIADMHMEEIPIETVTTEDGKPLKDVLFPKQEEEKVDTKDTPK